MFYKKAPKLISDKSSIEHFEKAGLKQVEKKDDNSQYSRVQSKRV